MTATAALVSLVATLVLPVAPNLAPPLAPPPGIADAADTDLEALLEIQKRVARALPSAIEKTVAIRVRVMGQEGYGSGAHIGDGYILTCAHVVEQSTEDGIRVVLSDGTEHEVKALGSCALNDYALLQIEKTDFPAFALGDSKAVEVGDWVGALGHPGGPYGDYQPAFSLGQVTSTKKKLPLLMFNKQYPDALRTNVQIFGGNSGGPLFDLDGRLLGLNGAIIVLNESAFTIPVHLIEPNLQAMKDGETIEGIQIDNPNRAMEELQRDLGPDAFNEMFGNIGKALEELFGNLPEGGLPEWLRRFAEGGAPPMPDRPLLGVEIDTTDTEGRGLAVARVTPDLGARAAGVKPGDRIVAIDGEAVDDFDALVERLSGREVGETVRVTVLRDGWEKVLSVELMSAR